MPPSTTRATDGLRVEERSDLADGDTLISEPEDLRSSWMPGVGVSLEGDGQGVFGELNDGLVHDPARVGARREISAQTGVSRTTAWVC